MKKFTLLPAMLCIASFSFGQFTKMESLQAVKQGDMKINTNFAQNGAKVDTDTLFNFDPATATLTVYGFPDPASWGYWTGQNYLSFSKCAEKFTVAGAGELNGFIYMPAVLYDAGSNSVTFKVWDDNAGEPGTELASETVAIADMINQAFNDVTFASPVSITAGDFYIGYEVAYNTPMDTTCMAQTQTSANDSYVFYYGGSWTDMPTLTGGAIEGTNLAIGARVNITYTDPVAEVNPTSWAAGGIEIGASTTSPTITLTNIGVGTLTVSSATDLSGTPFSTTFVAGDVNLATGATYDFTFDFSPTTAGAYNETFTIETNGGTVEVTLSGTGNNPITGDMDGGFETNVNDFDLTFTGWTQHDEDGSGTYGFSGINFPNSGYTGSYIAFNPATTDPPMTTGAISPHTGDRFGACFAAISPPNNDWLITPQTEVLNAGASVNMWVKSYTDDYGLERYEVYVSNSGTAIGDFTELTAGTQLADTLWTEINYDLSSYVGDQVYIAVRCVSDDAFIFMVDDIVIDVGVNVSDAEVEEISIYPNPANNVVTVANAENADISIVNMLGQKVVSQTATSSRETVNISDLSNGTYIIRIEDGNEVITQKLNVVK
ncbi:MAG: choice-of-anchor J domain-containing protein [Bacteroidales bacterium]